MWKLKSICLLSVGLGVALPMAAAAQEATPPAARSEITPPVPVAPLPEREWIPQGVDAVGARANSRTDFRIDRQMLVMAAKVDKDNENLRRVIAGVNGVSVRSFRYPHEVEVDSVAMEELVAQFRDAGWMHLVNKRREDGGPKTDLWIRLDGAAIRGIAVLMASGRQMHFVAVSGSITPLDLLHLSGHLGIPRMDGGVVVPVPGHEGENTTQP